MHIPAKPVREGIPFGSDILQPFRIFGHNNVWHRHYAQKFAGSRQGVIHRALMKAIAPFALRRVDFATFDSLSAAGYDVRTIDDGAVPLIPPPGEMPAHWKRPQPSIVPRLAVMRGATLFRDGSALLPDGNYCFFDICFRHHQDGRRNFDRKILKFVDPVTDEALIRRPGRRVEVSGRCFSTRMNYPWNMGHFMHCTLSRIYYEDLGVIAPGRVKIIAPHFFFPMQRLLFERVYAGYEIVETRPKDCLEVEELLLPSNLCSPTQFNNLAIAGLANRLRRIAASYAGVGKRKICVSRSDGKEWGTLGREFVNMEDYESGMRDLGYQVVEISRLGPEAQLSLFAETTDIIGIHGAGMMNMIMMPLGGNYTEITGAPLSIIPDWYCPAFTARCAMVAGHRVSGLVGSLDRLDRPIIDIEKLKTIIRLAS